MMERTAIFKSVLEQEQGPVVLCDLEHTILYMNPAAVSRYAPFGGAALVGKNLMGCHNPASGEKILQVLQWFEASPENNRVHTYYNEGENKDIYMVALRNEAGTLIGYYEQHLYRNRDMTPLYEMK